MYATQPRRERPHWSTRTRKRAAVAVTLPLVAFIAFAAPPQTALAGHGGGHHARPPRPQPPHVPPVVAAETAGRLSAFLASTGAVGSLANGHRAVSRHADLPGIR